MVKDKVKGLVIGALLGSAITATAAYASGAQIEVFFRPLTYLFDGVEKQPAEGSGFIYEGSTYVPLRFVSEALGKEVTWDGDTGTIRVDEPGANTVAASYQDGERTIAITKRMVDKQAAISQLYDPASSSYAQDANFRAKLTVEVASYLLAEGRVNAETLETASKEAPANLDLLKDQFEQYFQGHYQWESRLKELKLTEEDVLQLFRRNAVRSAYLNQQITEEAIRTAYEAAAETHVYDTATVRHILVGLKDETGKSRTSEEALKRSQEVLAKLRGGADFAATALEYSDDPGSKQNGGRYENAPVADWVEAFKNAVLKQEVGKIGEPVQTEYGYHIIQVESRQSPGIEEIRRTLTNRLLSEAYQKLMAVELPALQVAASNK